MSAFEHIVIADQWPDWVDRETSEVNGERACSRMRDVGIPMSPRPPPSGLRVVLPDRRKAEVYEGVLLAERLVPRSGGALGLLYLCGSALSITALIGLLMLMGIAAKAAVLSAMEGVENALVALSKQRVRSERLGRSADSYKEAARIAKVLFQQGSTSFLDELDAERSLYSSQDTLIQERVALAEDFIACSRRSEGAGAVGWM